MGTYKYNFVQIFILIFLMVYTLSIGSNFGISAGQKEHQNISTFSFVARDPQTSEIGIAVLSRFFSVGSVVPWAKANVGGIATQSFANTSFGWRGLELMEKSATPDEVIKILLRNDDNPERRQIGIVSADGKSATYTGKKLHPMGRRKKW
mgnify:CR=1 FL=1